MNVQRGSLVIADIGGYTRYLTGVELEHSQDILADLMSTVVRNLGSALRLAKLEGDAVFCYDLEEHPDGQALLAAVEGTYFSFRRRQRDIAHLTTCECNACIRIPTLDLKFVAHHGEFIVHDVAGNAELVGADVIKVHRLLKNEIDLTAYAFLTDSCIDRCKLEPADMGLKRHAEQYDDVGEVKGYLINLGRRWDEEQQRSAISVTLENADIAIEGEAPATPPVVWDVLTSPKRAFSWMAGLQSMDEDHDAGKRGVGTVVHCVHGGMAVDNEIVDWRPFQYYTQRCVAPMGTILMTIEFTPTNDDLSTHVAYRMKFLDEFPDAETKQQVMGMLSAQMEGNFANVRALFEKEPATR